jgi:hypothetical protein
LTYSAAPASGPALSLSPGDAVTFEIDYPAITAADGSIVNPISAGYTATWQMGLYNVDGSRGQVLAAKAYPGAIAAAFANNAASFYISLVQSDTVGQAVGAYWQRFQLTAPDGTVDGGLDGEVYLTPAPGAASGAVVANPGLVQSAPYGSAFALTTDTDFLTTDGGIVKALGYDFSDLQEQVLDYLDRPELAAMFPTWVRLFQNKLNRVLRTGMQEAQVVLTPSPITGGAPLPADYAAYRAVQHGSGPIWSLEYATPDVIAKSWPYPSGGIPRLFTIKGTTLFPIPVGPVLLTYYRGVQPYLSGVLNDWVLLGHFDTYLYGTLCEAELYLKNEERALSWNQRAVAAIQDIMAADRDARWGKAREMSLECMP